MNSKINCLHERCLCIVYCDKTSSFERLLEKDGSVTIHIRNLQTLATEIFKGYKNLLPAIIVDLFQFDKIIIIRDMILILQYLMSNLCIMVWKVCQI